MTIETRSIEEQLQDMRDAILAHDMARFRTAMHATDAHSNQAVLNAGLYIACQKKMKDLAEILIPWGADVNAQGPSSMDSNPLSTTALRNYSEMIELLLANGADPNVVIKDHPPPLFSAVCWGNEKIIRLMLDHGAKPDCPMADVSDQTPLTRAASDNKFPIVRMLVEAGADVNIPGYQGLHALSHAITLKNEDMFDYLFSRTTAPPVLFLTQAVDADNAHALKALFAKGADPSTTDAEGKTLLTRARENGHTAAAETITAEIRRRICAEVDDTMLTGITRPAGMKPLRLKTGLKAF